MEAMIDFLSELGRNLFVTTFSMPSGLANIMSIAMEKDGIFLHPVVGLTPATYFPLHYEEGSSIAKHL